MRTRVATKVLIVTVGLLALLLVGLAAWFWPRRWRIPGSVTGSRCVVSAGMSVADVESQCGAPLARGTQPKLMEGLSTLCSAPCERYEAHVVLHDCEGFVYSVAAAANAYQGCVFEAEAR